MVKERKKVKEKEYKELIAIMKERHKILVKLGLEKYRSRCKLYYDVEIEPNHEDYCTGLARRVINWGLRGEHSKADVVYIDHI